MRPGFGGIVWRPRVAEVACARVPGKEANHYTPRGSMVRAKWAVLGVVGVLALAFSGIIAAGALQSRGGGPEQPIAFPHDVHAGTLQIPCQYCHYSADRSPDAGIPQVQTCTGCHAPVGSLLFLQDSPELQKLMQYAEAEVPIPWVRIYDLPEHVRFPHMMHVNAGVACQDCHGPVEEMAEIELAQPLRMGWCIDCHQERQARVDCFVCHY